MRDCNIRLQFSLRSWLGVVTVVGSGSAAPRCPSERWAGGLFGLTPAVLYLLNLYRRDMKGGLVP